MPCPICDGPLRPNISELRWLLLPANRFELFMTILLLGSVVYVLVLTVSALMGWAVNVLLPSEWGQAVFKWVMA